MENLLDEEDEIYTKEINGIKCLYYKPKFKNQNITKDKRFKNWLKEEINKKGKICLLYRCDICNLFAYIKDNKERALFRISKDHSCSDKYFCTYCGNIYIGESYCCAKRGLHSKFYIYFFRPNDDEFSDNNRYIPLLFNILFIVSIYFALFLHRKLKVGVKEFSCYENKTTKLSKFAIIIAVLFILLNSFLYFFVFIIIYFIYIILYFIETKKNNL